MKKTLLSIAAITAFGSSIVAQNVNIPDANFKAYLVGNSLINTNSDTVIQVSEAIAFTGLIELNSLNASDLTGLEAFTGLTAFSCWNTPVGTLDLSQNTALTRLDLVNLNITSLDLTQNTALTRVEVSINSNLASIDVSQCAAMDTLFCSDNPNLTSIDVSQNAQLNTLWCHTSGYTSLDVSQNTNLVSLDCSFNNLTSLDVSQNINLTKLYCTSSSLTSLDMSNISTSTLTTFYATSNPNLTCIEVDNVPAATSAWTNIDPASSFSTNCVVSGINNKAILNSLSIYPNPVKSNLTIKTEEKVESIIIINVMGEIIKTIFTLNNTIDVSDLTNGIYFIQIQMENNIINKRFIKE